jgi:hypothetical protein
MIYMSSVNPITNPKPVCSHKTVAILKCSSEGRYKGRANVLCLSAGFPNNPNELHTIHPARVSQFLSLIKGAVLLHYTQ